MSVFVSNSVVLRYASTSMTFDALFADDENYEIISLPKKRIDWMLLENIIGYRTIFNVRLHMVSQAQRAFLYNFIQSSDQYVTINGVETSVFLRDDTLALDMVDGYIGNISLELEFEAKSITRITSATQAVGTTSASAGYKSTASGVGTVVTLAMNYGDGDVKRVFRVNSVLSYKADILDKRWTYIDKNNGVRRLGYRLNFEIDFGVFGFGQTQVQLQEDRDWIKEFVLAPSKRIEVFDQYLGDVINDFDNVQYDLIGGIIYNKSLKLSFKQQGLQTNLPVAPSSVFILDSETQGTLDHNILG